MPWTRWADLNTHPENYTCGNYKAGYSDWALPDLNELESLYHAGEADSSTWLNGMGFVNVQFGFYWSSTSDTTLNDLAWVMGNGFRDRAQ